MSSKICLLAQVPIRKEPSHRSEMVSQILFGEKAIELESENEWVRIRMDFDQYTGWIEKNCLADYSETAGLITRVLERSVTNAEMDGTQILLPAGSEITQVDENNCFLLANKMFKLDLNSHPEKKKNPLLDNAKQFLHAPYLWGGRTLFGIDCSGLVQIVYKTIGLKLPRDASDQARKGKLIGSMEIARPGDLIFFQSENAKIEHVGLYLGGGQILHASKKVRIDKVDNRGILNNELGRYTHNLHSINRIIAQ